MQWRGVWTLIGNDSGIAKGEALVHVPPSSYE